MMMKVKTRSHDHEIWLFFLSKFCGENFENTVIIFLLLVFHCFFFAFFSLAFHFNMYVVVLFYLGFLHPSLFIVSEKDFRMEVSDADVEAISVALNCHY